MDEIVGLFLEGQRQFDARLRAIGADQWKAPTPDSEWCVSDLVEHLIDEQRWVAPLLNGHFLPAAEGIVKAMAATHTGAEGPDLAAAWDDAVVTAADAVREPGALGREVNLSRGLTPAARYLTEMIFDLTVHSWDLGKAIGQDDPLPDELVAFVYTAASSMGGEFAGSDMFAAPVPVPEDAPMIDRLIGLTGRHPH